MNETQNSMDVIYGWPLPRLVHDDAVRVQDAFVVEEAAEAVPAVVAAADAAPVHAGGDGLLEGDSIDI